MRSVIVLLLTALAGCGTTYSDGATCPQQLEDGDACGFTGRCWRASGFASCLSEWCSCVGGAVTCEALAPSEGDACGDEPITSCYYEGNPDCDTPPTAESCYCAAGTWQCSCACWGGETCFQDPCSLPPERIDGATCADVGATCTYPNNRRCVCEGAPERSGTFVCT